MAKGLLAISLHGAVLTGAVALALWAAGINAASARYDTATPYSPPKYKYIPLHSSYNDETPDNFDSEDETTSSGMPTSELILTLFRTALDVVRKINRNRSAALLHSNSTNSTALQSRRSKADNSTGDAGRGFEDYYDEHHHEHYETTTTMKPMKQGRYTDPWAGYYDWIINEGSFKFWSVFQLFTAALLLYACLSAIYYAKFNPIIPDYSLEYDDYFLERSAGRKARSVNVSETPSGISWISPTTFQFILNAISKQYKTQ